MELQPDADPRLHPTRNIVLRLERNHAELIPVANDPTEGACFVAISKELAQRRDLGLRGGQIGVDRRLTRRRLVRRRFAGPVPRLGLQGRARPRPLELGGLVRRLREDGRHGQKGHEPSQDAA